MKRCQSSTDFLSRLVTVVRKTYCLQDRCLSPPIYSRKRNFVY